MEDITKYNINGNTIYDTPAIRCGVLITKTVDNITSCDPVLQENRFCHSTYFLIYKRNNIPGNKPKWSIPFRFMPYGETMQETAVKAAIQQIRFPLTEHMLSPKCNIEKTVYDDKHTGAAHFNGPVNVMFTFQYVNKDSYLFIKELYDELTEAERHEERGKFLANQFLTFAEQYKYNPYKEADILDIPSIKWVTFDELKSMLENNDFDEPTQWCLEEKLSQCTY